MTLCYNARWIGPSAAEIVWQRLGDSYVAYHRPSGKTHFLNAASHFLIADVLDNALDADSVVRAIGSENSAADRDSESEIRSGILELLDRLERLGLISRA